MAVLAARIAMRSVHPAGLGMLLVLVLVATLAAAAYFVGREYINRGRRAPGREQSLGPWFMLGLMIIGAIALVGRYWQ
jgi:hypothetical protein